MSIHMRKQFMDFFKESNTGFILIENQKVVYINPRACDIFGCDNGQQSLIKLMSSDTMKRITEGLENRIEKIEINDAEYDVYVLFGDDTMCIFIHELTNYEKVERDMKYKACCIKAITQYQKQIIDNIATMLMGDDDPDLYKLMIKNVYRRIYKSNGALTELTESMISKCKNKGCYNLGYIVEQVLENVKNLFPNLSIEIKGEKKSIDAYCDSTSIQTAVYSVVSAFLYPDVKEGAISVECTKYKGNSIITITGKDIAWGADQLAYLRGERPEKLLIDIHRFGYDMLRVASIMEWQDGGFDVKVLGNSTQVSLKLSSQKKQGGELIMNSNDCKHLSREDVSIIFSDIE